MPRDYRGPGGRHPGKLPLRGRAGHWTANQTSTLSFGAPNTTYNAATAISGTHFRTPVFDLRYDLGDVDGFGQRRQKNVEADVMLGIEFNLFLRVDITFAGTITSQSPAFKFYALEFGDPMDPNKPQFMQTRLDITSSVLSGYQTTANSLSATLLWTPPGPIRYWGVAFICDQISALDAGGNPIVATPDIRITGALH